MKEEKIKEIQQHLELQREYYFVCETLPNYTVTITFKDHEPVLQQLGPAPRPLGLPKPNQAVNMSKSFSSLMNLIFMILM
jgi:hypothetical protein